MLSILSILPTTTPAPTKRGRKISENFYARQDGTRAYYFTIEELHDIFVKEGGFIVLENEYIRRQYANRGQKIARYRSWVHAKFQRPREEGSSS
jgi:methyltransferase-like protein 6